MAEEQAKEEGKVINWIYPYEVTWNEERVEWIIRNNKTGQGPLPLNCVDRTTLEVIGNIYENPELLDQ